MMPPSEMRTPLKSNRDTSSGPNSTNLSAYLVCNTVHSEVKRSAYKSHSAALPLNSGYRLIVAGYMFHNPIMKG